MVAACLQPGVSIAGVALANRLNANLLRNWVHAHRDRQVGGVPARLGKEERSEPAHGSPPTLVPVTLAQKIADLCPLTTPMHSLKLCAVFGERPALTTVLASAGAHSYNVCRNFMSESGGLNRRNVVSGASSRASAFSFIARSAST